MNLIIFDIDGTLINTSKVDAECFANTFNEMYLAEMPLTDRSQFVSSTDSGLLQEAAQYYLGKQLCFDEIQSFKKTFISKLYNQIARLKSPSIYGANRVFNELQHHSDVDVAIATGAWLETAVLKLDAVAINYHDVPFASANDYQQRTLIIQHAIDMSTSYYQHRYQKIIYVGDRHWDYLAAKQLEIEFYGIGDDHQMKEVNKHGKGSADYGDANPFIA